MTEMIDLRAVMDAEYERGLKEGLAQSTYQRDRVRDSDWVQSFRKDKYEVGEWCEAVLRECFHMCQELVPIDENSSVHALMVLSGCAFREDWKSEEWGPVLEMLKKTGGKGEL